MGNSFRQTIAGLFAHKQMTPTRMMEGHLAATITRAKAADGAFLLALQDTTYYNYCSHPAMKGLGKIRGDIKGVIQHNVLLTSQLGIPLGILNQQYWSRQGAVEFVGKESLKWERGLDAVNKHLTGLDKKVVLVQDREADVLDFFNAQRQTNVDLLVRVHQPRQLAIADSGQVLALPHVAHALAVLGEQRVCIERDGKPVELALNLKASQVSVLPGAGAGKQAQPTQGLSLVVAQEVGAVDEKGGSVFDPDKAVVWFLLSSLPIDSQEDIERVVRFYSLRWQIERFHYVLKSGALNVEKRQFDDLQTLLTGLAFYSIVGWQLLAITYILRHQRDSDAGCCFEPMEVELLRKASNKPIGTVGEATLALTKLIGFAPSRRHPMPGVRVLAQALERFYYLKMGFSLNDP